MPTSQFANSLDLFVQATNGSPFTGTVTFSLRRQGGSFYAAQPSQVTSLGQGFYRLTPSTSDSAIPGWLVFVATGSGAVNAYGVAWCGWDVGPLAGVSSPYYSLPFVLVDSSGNAITGATPTVLIDTPGGSGFAAPHGTVVEVGMGVYEVLPTAADVAEAGPMPIEAGATGSLVFADEVQLFPSAGSSGSQTFRQALYSKLASISELTAIVGPAIYPGALPETHDLGRDGPALTFTVASRPANHQLTGSDGTATASVQLSAWSYQELQSEQIALVLFNALDGLVNDNSWGNGTVLVRSCLQDDEIDMPADPKAGSDQWIYQVPSIYKIKHTVVYPTNS